jgi:hypothetical protein
MTLIFHPTKKVLYATDAGHGFAVARTEASQPIRARGIAFDPSTQAARRDQSRESESARR